MERQHYAVLVAGSGQEALDVAGRLNPDLVVLDLMLPDLAGEEVARSLRAISPVPIIMLTAKAGEADRVAGLRLGADDYVVKPFSPLELVARVDAVLRRARPGGADGLQSFGAGSLVTDQAGRSPRPSHPCRTGMNTRTNPNNRSTEPAVSAGQGFLQRIRFGSCLMIGETVPATDVSANLRHRRRQRLQTLRGNTYQAELRHFADMIRPWGDQLKK